MFSNINEPRLCNGTGLAVKHFCDSSQPDVTTYLPFAFKRLQFFVHLAVAMTIKYSLSQCVNETWSLRGNILVHNTNLY